MISERFQESCALTEPVARLSDAELISFFSDLLIEGREKLVLELEIIGELDRRKCFFHYSSLRSYLVVECKMEEHTAERKIRASRMLRRFPELKEELESGRLTITHLEFAQGCAYREKLSDLELSQLFQAISGKSCKQAQKEIATLYPSPNDTLPQERIRPLTEELSEVRFVASEELVTQIEEIRGLLFHSHPKLNLGELFEILTRDYLDRHHPEKKAERALQKKKKEDETEIKVPEEKPNAEQATEIVSLPTLPWVRDPKRVPSQQMIHALIHRDGYQCSYFDERTKTRCTSRFALEIDHKKSWASGGRTELVNLRFLCVNHHARVSFLEFGEYSQKGKR